MSPIPQIEPGTFAAAFDPLTGDYILGRDGINPRGQIQRIAYSAISAIQGSPFPLSSQLPIDILLSKSTLEAEIAFSADSFDFVPTRQLYVF